MILGNIIVTLTVPLVSFQGVRPMKSLFIPIFALLSVVVQADSYIFPPIHYSAVPSYEVVSIEDVPSRPVSSGMMTIVAEPVYVDKRIVTPMSHAVKKPAEKPISVPQPLEPLAPVFPKQDFLQHEEELSIFRGQFRSVDEIKEILDSPPSVAKGAIESETISPDLAGSSDAEESEMDTFSMSLPQNSTSLPQNSTKIDSADRAAELADPLGYGMLLVATIVMMIGLVIMAFVAYDYHQRWVHSMTAQNDRYLGGGTFDMDMDG